MQHPKVTIGSSRIGDNERVFVIAEIGINHNGDVATAKKLIDAAVTAGADAVKFQKRTVSVVYTPEELAKSREMPATLLVEAVKRGALSKEAEERLTASQYKETTNGDLKYALEFGEKEYREIDRYTKEKGILWFASPWDEQSVDFLETFNLPAYKVASASLTDDGLLRRMKATGRPIILSTGMSTMEEVDHAIEVLGKDNLVVMHCVSTYPAELSDLNLSVIPVLRERYGVPVGYSGHERGVYTSVCAAAMGAVAVERHITLDRAMWGTDQAASVEPKGFELLVQEIRNFEKARGDGVKKVLESEVPIIKKLRRVGAKV